MAANSKDIYSSFYPFYRFLRCFGLLPFTFDPTKRVFVEQTRHKIISFILLSVVICAQSVMVFHCQVSHNSTSSIQLLLNIDSSIVFAIQLIYFNQRMYRIINLLRKFADLDRDINFRYLPDRELALYCFLNVTLLVTYITVDVVILIQTTYPTSILCMFSQYNSSLSFLILRVTFAFCINEVRLRFKFFQAHTNQSKDAVALRHLVELREICKIVTSLYNFPLARNLGKIFLYLTINLVLLLLVPEFTGENALNIFVLFMWWFLTFAEMILVIYPVENLCTEVHHTY
jgi:hypothetical protein